MMEGSTAIGEGRMEADEAQSALKQIFSSMLGGGREKIAVRSSVGRTKTQIGSNARHQRQRMRID